jgi:hypothetical protein
MGLLNSAKGDPERALLRKEHGVWVRLLGAGEQVSTVHRLGRTTLLFTNRRLVLVEEGMTGRKVEYVSIPYRSITHFSVDASGPFGVEADLKLWVAGRAGPIEKQFGPGVDVYAVQALLAQQVAGSV